MHKVFCLIACFFLVNSAFANDPVQSAIRNENIYNEYLESIKNDQAIDVHNEGSCYVVDCTSRLALLVNALDQLVQSQRISKDQFAKVIKNLDLNLLKLNLLIDLYGLSLNFEATSSRLKSHIVKVVSSNNSLTAEEIHQLNEFPELLGITLKAPTKPFVNNIDAARDLFQMTPSSSHYKNGRYDAGVKLYMFCRYNRQYPCLFLMRDKNDKIVSSKDQKIWTQPSLGLSKWGRPYYKTNGNTPMGVFRIDGVMPTANKKIAFGKYRRLILNFVNKSPNEITLRSLLPKSSENLDWWQESVTARENGRALFRIHGTGLKNSDSKTPYHPLVPTSGCVAQRENTYDDILYNDQRVLLDTMMQAQGLNPIYENEEKIRGLLYIINLDKKNKPVTLNELKKLNFF